MNRPGFPKFVKYLQVGHFDDLELDIELDFWQIPKIIPEKQIGSAYAFIFWIQNFGLWGIPLLIGIVLERTNPGIADRIQEIMANFKSMGLEDDQITEKVALMKEAGEYPIYNYETTWMIFVGLTVLALIVAIMLKAEDKKKGYGLELPNIVK